MTGLHVSLYRESDRFIARGWEGDFTLHNILMKRAPFLFGAAAGAKWVQVYRSSGKGRKKRPKWTRL